MATLSFGLFGVALALWFTFCGYCVHNIKNALADAADAGALAAVEFAGIARANGKENWKDVGKRAGASEFFRNLPSDKPMQVDMPEVTVEQEGALLVSKLRYSATFDDSYLTIMNLEQANIDGAVLATLALSK